MNFLTQQQELAAQLGLDSTDTDTAVLLKRWLNTSQQMIAQSAEWPFLRSSTPYILQTEADISTGTVTTTSGSGSVTFSSAPAASVAGYYLKSSSSEDWYRITAHTAGQTSATISPSAIHSLSAGTYTVRKFYYALDSTVDRVLQIRQGTTPFQLREMDKEAFDKMHPSPDDTGSPSVFVMAGKNSSDNWQVILWPTPDSVMNLYVDYIKAATDLSADGDVSVIPAKWHTSVMLDGAKWQGWQFTDDSRMDQARQNFYHGLERMQQELMPSAGRSHVMRSVDSQESLFPFPLPSNYGRE